MHNRNNHIKLGHCAWCNDLFAFDPGSVPAITDQAPRCELMYPICRACIDRINRRLLAGNKLPFMPVPGAYGGEETN